MLSIDAKDMNEMKLSVFLLRTQVLMFVICILIITFIFIGPLSDLNPIAVLLGSAVSSINLLLVWKITSAITKSEAGSGSALFVATLVKLPALLALVFLASSLGPSVLNGAALGFMCFVPALILSGLSLGLRD